MAKRGLQLGWNWGVYSDHLGGYMSRWIAMTPWGTGRIHLIKKSDDGRDFHDHPWNFTSLILRGGYREHVPGCACFPREVVSVEIKSGWKHTTRYTRPTPCRDFRAGSVLHRKATDFHRLELLDGPTLTAVIGGPYLRTWGFLLPDGSWEHYKAYHARLNR